MSLSYERLEAYEPVGATNSVCAKSSFSIRKDSYDPPRSQSPLVSIKDLKNYVRSEGPKNRNKLSHEFRINGSGLSSTTYSDKLNKNPRYISLGHDRSGKGLGLFGRLDSGIDMARDDKGTESLYSGGDGQPEIITAYGEGEDGSLRLEGKTDAFFDGGSFKTAGVKVVEAEGCSCTEDKCIRARGTLNAKYSVRTKVTLPRVSDYPDLSVPQKKRLQEAVTTVLAPHEQKHVAAFKKYNGSTSKPFDLTICKGEFDSTIQSIFDEEQAARRQGAQAESDALDPFFFDFEL